MLSSLLKRADANQLTASATTDQGGARSEAPRPVASPAVDLFETATEVELVADLPGVPEDGIEITLDQGILTLRGRSVASEPSGLKRYRLEYAACDFERRFAVSEVIDPASIKARLADGVLTVTMPKAAQAQPRKIAVTPR